MQWQITRDKYLSKAERDKLLKATEAKAIVDQAKGRSTWVKRWMLVDLALFSGLRVSEVAGLRISDVRLNGIEKVLYIRCGKGGKSGLVAIDSGLARHLKDFISWKRQAQEPADAESFLLTGSADGRVYTINALQKQFKEVLKNAGLPLSYSIHACRHTFATYLLAETKNLRLVQKQLRHSSPGVTAVYADITPEDMTAAMENFRGNEKAFKKGICKLCNANVAFR